MEKFKRIRKKVLISLVLAVGIAVGGALLDEISLKESVRASFQASAGETVEKLTPPSLDALHKLTEELQSKVGEEFERVREGKGLSPYTHAVFLERKSDLGGAYIQIVVGEARERVVLSEWSIESTHSESRAVIPEVVETPLVGQVGKKAPLVAKQGDVIILSHEGSTVGASFQENICSGFLEQFQDFHPSLSSSSCPSPEGELAGASPSLFEQCSTQIQNLSACRVLDAGVENLRACEAFAVREYNYNSCVERHKEERGFGTGVWRVFLDTENLFESRHDIIRLYDREKRLVDILGY